MNEIRHGSELELKLEMYPPINPEKLRKYDPEDSTLIKKFYNQIMVRRIEELYTTYQNLYLTPSKQYDPDAVQVTEFQKLIQSAAEECFEIARDKVRILKTENDDLTGFLRRDGFASRYEIALRSFERAQPEDEVIALLFIDIDDMNYLNTTYKHGTVDKLLKAMGKKLSKEIRAVDAACRYGGDEVLTLLDHIKKDSVESTVERLYTALATLSIIEDAEGNYLVKDLATEELSEGEKRKDSLSLSIGVRTITKEEIGHIAHIDQIIAEADEAVYHTKSLGKGGVTFIERWDETTGEPLVKSLKYDQMGTLKQVGEGLQPISKEAAQNSEVIQTDITKKLRRTLECAYQRHNQQLPPNIEQAIRTLANEIYGVCYT